MRRSLVAITILFLAAPVFAGCDPGSDAGTGGSSSTGDTGGGGAGGTGTATADDLDMTEADFECIKNWDQVNLFFLTNKLGDVQGALDVAKSADGGTYPVGTIIQLIPTEAMVKRKAGFSAETNDWEFFFLEVSEAGTTIAARGTTDVVNQFGGNCFDCHSKAEPKWDLVCEKTHGCDPLPLSDSTIVSVQNADPRCK